MAPLVSLAEVKTYLGMTGTADDGLIASAASNASIMVERDTGRVFAVTSNVTRKYSTNGEASLTIHDRPISDATRVVTVDGTTMTEDTGYWMLPDWRDNLTSSTIQLRYYDRSRPDWYKADPMWFDKNLDHYPYSQGTPNDLVITGTEGHPVLPLDVFEWTRRLAAFLYWQAKGGASGFVQSPEGQEFDLSQDRPPGYERFVKDWTIKTAVVGI
jgi:hypothetical protein